MEYIDNIKEKPLDFLLAGYGNKMIYHEYDSEKQQLNAGKPLTEESLRAIFKVLNSKFIDFDMNFGFKGMIPKNVIKFLTDEKKIIWYSPSGMKKLFFSDKLEIETSYYPIPTLLWKLDNNSLFVYALDSIPKSLDSPVYNAPFLNVYESGSICMGNVSFTNDSLDYEEIMKVAEAAFFNSYFTHTNSNKILKENIVDFMKEMKAKDVQKFNVRKLVKYKSSILNIL